MIQDWIKRQSISGGTINKKWYKITLYATLHNHVESTIYIEIQRCTRVVTT